MLDKDLAQRLIVEYQDFINNISFIERDIAIDYKGNNVFVGLRRAGKSYLLYQSVHQLIKKGHKIDEILFFNFEDDRIDGLQISDLDTIKLAYEEMYGTKPIFFLDEIQIVEHWEKFARRLVDTGYQVFITGSNAKMLSNEIATTLGGRFYITEVFPFSFAEYLKINNISLPKNWQYTPATAIIRNFQQFFVYGGLPEVIEKEEKFKREWLSSLFNKIYFSDLLMRYSIRNNRALKVLIRKMAESVMQPVTYNRIAAIVSAAGFKIKSETAAEYCQYLTDSYLMFAIENYASKLQDKVSVKKYYFCDNGFISLFVTDADTLLLENFVAITLRIKYPDELMYFNSNVEVDFYLPEQKISYQVSYSIKDPQTREREVRALVRLNNYIPQNQMFIITKDEEEIIEVDGSKIYVVPAWKWVLG
ncbi:MAG: ATP-binding protein [Bacteroidales bacterium]|nr:ATP-binding protein [Bacteroidales bacterium]